MTELFRVRVDPALLRRAQKVCAELGTSAPEVVRMCLAQVVARRAIPFEIACPPRDNALAGPWAARARMLESFYDDSKTW